MSSLKERCQAVVTLDRAEDAADDTRAALTAATLAGEPVQGYWTAYRIALRALAAARYTLHKMEE